jgi:serine/threonine protein phosphatase PrpC
LSVPRTDIHRVRAARSPHHDSASAAAFVREAVFATRRMRLDAAVVSSRGARHAVNEDAHSTLDGNARVYVVADGVSTGAMASSASRELVARLHEALEREPIDAATIANALLDADREIRKSIASCTDAPGAATVALAVAVDPALSRWLVAWVGDCRVYRVGAAREVAELLTRDDTYRHLDEAPPTGGSPDDPARMVGNGAVDAPNVREATLGDGETLVLASDGVHRHADPRVIRDLLCATTPLARRCVRLVEHARAHGSKDDATVLAVHRVERARPRLARLLSGSVLIALVAATLALLAADDVAAPRLDSQHTLSQQGEP